MTKHAEPRTPRPDTDSADELEADIERTREELGETIDALSQKFDVKSRASDKMHDGKERVNERVRASRVRANLILAQVKEGATNEQGKTKPAVSVGVGLAAAGVAAVIVAVWHKSR